MKNRSLLALLAMSTVTLTAAVASATECADNADCGDGEFCALPDCAPCDPTDPDCAGGGGDCGPGVCMSAATTGMPSECVTDAECPTGLTCEIVGGTACAGAACPPGEPCPEPEPCVAEDIYACVAPPPPPCASDADCGEGLVCISETFESCPPVAMPDCAGPDCPEPPAVDCITEDYSYCAPRWMAPCTTASDCGDGFTCEPQEVCACSGGGAPTDPSSGGGSSGSSGGSPGTPGSELPPIPPDASGSGEATDPGRDPGSDCFCEPTGTNYCKLPDEPTTCSTDADCPSEWTCEELPGDTTCVSDSAGNTDCTDADPVSYCLPPYWEEAVTAADSAGDFEATRGGEEQNSGGGVSSPLDNLPPAAEAAAGGGTATDGGGGASTRSSDGGESGCSAAATGAGLGSMLLTMFGLVGLRRRRTTR